MISRLRGTYDILPADIDYWHFVEEKARDLFDNANYAEMRTPIIEQKELFQKGVGQSTDIVNKEMYSFQDQGKRNLVLRPEGTAGIARSFIQNKLYNTKNINKIWYKGPMFRYERPQNGRQRQFNQLGVECLGVKDPQIDAEVIAMAYNLLLSLNIGDFRLEINNIGDSSARQLYSKELTQYLIPYQSQLDSDSVQRLSTNPLRILDSKSVPTQNLLINAPNLFDYISSNSKQHFETLCCYLNALKIPYTINHRLVRGLDYYSDTAFEFKTDLLGGQDTICGGGRYDSLITNLDGPHTPAIGWAIGIERLLILVKKNYSIPKKSLDFYIISDNILRCKIEAIVLFNHLTTKHNVKVEVDMTESTIRKKIKRAYKSNSYYCLIIGENEASKGRITVKNLINNEEKCMHMDHFLYKSDPSSFQFEKV
uniref:histidine-tRNA synthetase n=1 Tax=Sahlingia subintegra TaxID=468936 RepID=UPI001FCD4C09|nr:histidine-tRNA synthetase [Sahlingia subintegra]UNJ17354.1 histidine-tRNA synthetase [Sahlingia subintegra]